MIGLRKLRLQRWVVGLALVFCQPVVAASHRIDHDGNQTRQIAHTVPGHEHTGSWDFAEENFTVDVNIDDVQNAAGAGLKEFFSEAASDHLFLKESDLPDDGLKIYACEGKYTARNGIDGLYAVVDESDSGEPQLEHVIVNEAKYRSGGGFPAFDVRENGVAQMSWDWIVHAADELEEQEKDYCPSREENCDGEICQQVRQAMQVSKLRSRDREVYRTATVMDDYGRLALYALGYRAEEYDRTREVLARIGLFDTDSV